MHNKLWINEPRYYVTSANLNYYMSSSKRKCIQMWSTWQQEVGFAEGERLSCIHRTDYFHAAEKLYACIDQVWTEPPRNKWRSCKWFVRAKSTFKIEKTSFIPWSAWAQQNLASNAAGSSLCSASMCAKHKYRFSFGNFVYWKIQALRHWHSLCMRKGGVPDCGVYFMHWGRERSCVPGIWEKEKCTCLGDHATLWSAAPDGRGGAARAAVRWGEGRVPEFPLGHARCTWKKKIVVNKGHVERKDAFAFEVLHSLGV